MSSIKSRKHARPGPLSLASLPAATLMTGLALSPLAASAQTASTQASDEAQSEPPEHIVVFGEREKRYSSDTLSSRKFTQPLLDTTQTVNVIGADLFNEQGATSLTDALRNSPGVGTFFVGENGSTSTGDTVYMRGFDSSSSIFVDGVRDLGSISRDVFNVEQVEVEKGPAGTDNGRSAPTGAINMVTKQPFRQDSDTVMLSSGSADERRATVDVNRYLGNGIGLRLNVMAQDSGVPGRDEVNRKRWGIAPSAAFGLGSATRIYIDLLHIDQDNIPDGGVPTIGLPGYVTPDPARPQIGAAPRVDSTNFYGTTSDYDDVTANMFTLRVEHDFSDTLHLQNTTRWGRNHQDYMLTSFMASDDPARFPTPDLDDPSTWELARALPNFKDQTNKIATNQTNLTVHFGGRTALQNDLSTGVELTREELDTTGIGALNGTAWPLANLYDPNPRVTGLEWGPNGESGAGSTDTVSAYAFDTVKLGERWQLNGGLRFDHYTTDYSSLEACGGRRGPDCGGLPNGTVVPGVDASVSDTLSNWKLGVLYKPAENGSVYVDYATSQQPPGGGSLELSSRANSLDNPIFDPEEAQTSELGTKWNLLGENLLFTASLYNTEVSNEIVQDPVDQQYYQFGKKRVRGIELSAVGKISDAWSLSAGFTTMDAEVEEGPAVSQDGSRNLAYTPDAAFTAWTTYVFPVGLTIGGGVRYAGEMHRGKDGAPGTPEFTEAYTVWDAVLSYAVNDHLDLRLNADNLFDEDYVAAINKSGYRYTPGVPRSFLLTANLRF